MLDGLRIGAYTPELTGVNVLWAIAEALPHREDKLPCAGRRNHSVCSVSSARPKVNAKEAGWGALGKGVGGGIGRIQMRLHSQRARIRGRYKTGRARQDGRYWPVVMAECNRDEWKRFKKDAVLLRHQLSNRGTRGIPASADLSFELSRVEWRRTQGVPSSPVGDRRSRHRLEARQRLQARDPCENGRVRLECNSPFRRVGDVGGTGKVRDGGVIFRQIAAAAQVAIHESEQMLSDFPRPH